MSQTPSLPALHEITRIEWQCRRGLLELDVLLGNFLKHDYPQLSDALKTDFLRLLQQPDQLLLYWFTDQQHPPADFVEMIRLIKKPVARPVFPSPLVGEGARRVDEG